MISQPEAFDIICDKIAAREQFTGELVAQASNGTPSGYLRLGHWLGTKGYITKVQNRVITYYFTENFQSTPAGTESRRGRLVQ